MAQLDSVRLAIHSFKQSLDGVSADVLLNLASAAITLHDLLPEAEADEARAILDTSSSLAAASLQRTFSAEEFCLGADTVVLCLAGLEKHAAVLEQKLAAVQAEYDALPQRMPYELLGVLCHDGSMSLGHYIAFVRAGRDGWLKFNDSHVESVRGLQCPCGMSR